MFSYCIFLGFRIFVFLSYVFLFQSGISYLPFLWPAGQDPERRRQNQTGWPGPDGLLTRLVRPGPDKPADRWAPGQAGRRPVALVSSGGKGGSLPTKSCCV